MRIFRNISSVLMVCTFMVLTVIAVAMPQDNKGKREPVKRSTVALPDTSSVKDLSDVIIMEDESVPDSLIHPRWKIQRTTPINVSDLEQNPADLRRPENLEQKVVYNDSIDRYIVGYRMGGTYVDAPLMMDLDEYLSYVGRKQRAKYYREKNDEIYQQKGKEKFDFTDMQFDLGPAEKIFGPGGVRIKTQGTAELKLGATMKNVENPSLPVNNRKTTTIDFDEKININMTGKVGDKINMGLNYNTDATFDFDQQNLKLKYEGKEDEIIKLVEAGNVSFPSNSSLIQGATSLFGLRTDLQFGKLKLQTVFSQKKSNSTSVSAKGGTQMTPFEIDVANYEENRHFFFDKYFYKQYDNAMSRLPNLTTGIRIGRVEVWVTNKSGATTNTRNIIALTDLGETSDLYNKRWAITAPIGSNSYNKANTEYEYMTRLAIEQDVRNIELTAGVLDGEGLVGGADYEKIERARLLPASEYTVNSALGYISLRTNLQTDQVLAIAYEYTYNGQTFQVGEFSSDITENSQALLVKSLKNVACNPSQGNWRLMMKNVYYLASTVEKTKFRLDVKFQSDTTGVYITYLPEPEVKSTPLIRVLGADRLDNNNKPNPNGYFDFVEGYTVSNGRVFFPKAEPFGKYLSNYLVSKGVASSVAQKYAYTELYDSTKTTAKQIAEKDKYILTGQFKGTAANVISIGSYNIPQGSVIVTAGGMTLTEGSDYTVDYAAGEVTIINQSIIDAGTNINVSTESNTDYGQQKKSMFGINWSYDFSKDFQLSGTFQHISEQALTTKVAMGSEPLNNTLWGLNINWKKESQWLTNMLDKLPFLHLTAPSHIQFQAEFAQLIAGQASGTQDNASYLDDFENTKNTIDVSTATSWVLASTPSMFSNYNDKTSLKSGYDRALLSWFSIDPLFTRQSSSLTPANIKSDPKFVSNHYVREVSVNEVYPNRDISTYNGQTNILQVLNLAYYPEDRGPYNFNPTALNSFGKLTAPETRWGGMMRKLDTSDFETANVEYIEFWMMDPFIQGSHGYEDISGMGGDLYINLGEVSEDILCDGKKFYESGLPVDGSDAVKTTQWGKVPTQAAVTYAFSTTPGARALQDLGYNGLNDQEELAFPHYQEFRQSVMDNVTSPLARDSILADLAGDNYHYFRGNDLDAIQPEGADILRRYKYINGTQGNSPDADSQVEGYDSSYKTTPDVEDINQDFTLNEYEKYYQYRIPLAPGQMKVGQGFIVDERKTSPMLRDGKSDMISWYLFRIPIRKWEKKQGNISDYSSIRFMRMFLTNCKKPIVLRFASLDLVRGEWRVYNQALTPATSGHSSMTVAAVNYEENNNKTPVNYVLPPGISRVVDPSQPSLTQSNEQALAMTVENLGTNESKCVYKNTTLDLRSYKHIQMFVHAHALENDVTNLKDNQLALFVRLGSDYKSNYYEYEIPLMLTPPGHYDTYSANGCQTVWPQTNMLDVDLSVFTDIKKERNKKKSQNQASYNTPYSQYDGQTNKKVTVLGNPSLGEVKTMIIGVRNLSSDEKSGEVWVNELRLQDPSNEGGWAAQGSLNVQMSDFGTVSLNGKYQSSGYGGLEQTVTQRSTDNYMNYAATFNAELGKFFPDKAKVSIPFYYSVTKEKKSPKYNPLDTDMELKDALDACETQHERDSIESIAVTKTVNTNFSISNAKVGIATKGHPMPYDPANFSISYSHSHRQTEGETTVYEKEDNWRGALSYAWSPNYKSFEPFKNIKSKSKYYDIIKKFGLNYLPQSIGFNTEMTRNYYELQERDMESVEMSLVRPTWSSQFLWNRDLNVRWDLTKNLHFQFQSATHAEIEEPYTIVNKDLYPDRYDAWKDSVWTSIKHMGTPLDYSQNVTASYKVPLNLIPIFDWLTADAGYSSTYNWARGSDTDDGVSLGNTIAMSRTVSINSGLNMEKLYNHFPFLKKANERFNKTSRNQNSRNQNARNRNNLNQRGQKKDDKKDPKAQLPKNKNVIEKELTLYPDSMIEFTHGKKSKRLIVTAKDKDGKLIPIRYKKKDDNKIMVALKGDSTMKVKIMVSKKPELDDQRWYRLAQSGARFLMMVRNINISYKNNYSLSLPGFRPNAGDILGQNKTDGLWAPGIGFALGFADDSAIDKFKERGWLLTEEDSIATPAATNTTEDLQIRLTLEPVKNLKIDLNASRTISRAKSIQYMYKGNPTTESGSFNMTTLSIGSAFESMGDATNGFYSSTFEKFCNSLEGFRQRVEDQYRGALYPRGSGLHGQVFDPAKYGGVNKYSSDVMIPAFLDAYTSSGGGLELFPSISKIIPNWSIKYSGLGQLPWIRDHFKSVNLSHAYKSVFAIGSYSSYSTFMEYMGGLGFITDATTGNPIPNSMYNVSQVSINEAFSPLLGVDVTLNNNMTFKLEYKSTRVLNLSMTSVQLTESTSKDWVFGMGYKIQDFNFLGGSSNRHRQVKGGNKKANGDDDSDNKSKSKSSSSRTSRNKGFSHDLNIRLDLSYRSQAAINRDIQTMTSTATSGNNAFKLSFTADYALSRLITMSFYFDRQTNTPLLSSSAYPTTTQDFGLSLKMSLTR